MRVTHKPRADTPFNFLRPETLSGQPHRIAPWVIVYAATPHAVLNENP